MAKKKRDMSSLGVLSLIGLAIGVGVGLFLMFLGGAEVSWIAFLLQVLNLVGQVFLSLIKMIIVPLVFCCVTNAIIGLKDMSLLRSLGSKTMLFFLGTSALFGIIGIIVAEVANFGASFPMEQLAQVEYSTQALSPFNTILNFFSTNIVSSMASGEMVQVIIFCVFFGAAVLSLGEKGSTIANFLIELEQAIFKIVGYVMTIMPIGVFCLMTYSITINGPKMLGGLLKFVLLDWIIVIIGIFTVHLFLLRFVAKVRFFKFFAQFKESLTIALATTSSTTTLPFSTKTAKEKIGVPAHAADFVIPLGSTCNMNGSAGYFALVTIFVGQMVGYEFTMVQYVMIVIQGCLLAVATSTVPSSGIVMAFSMLTSYGLPTDFLGLLIGVYKFCDMAHTPTNCMGDWVAATCISATDGTLDRDVCVCNFHNETRKVETK